MIEHVYFLLDELNRRIRIGKTENLLRRLLDNQKENGFRLKLLGVTEGGYEREQEIQRLFPALRLPRESQRGKRVMGSSDDWFRADQELLDWIAAHTKPWDGGDTFHWQSNISSPTLAMYGTAEWVQWVEEFSQLQNGEVGELVELALAALALQRGFRPPPQRIVDARRFPPSPDVARLPVT